MVQTAVKMVSAVEAFLSDLLENGIRNGLKRQRSGLLRPFLLDFRGATRSLWLGPLVARPTFSQVSQVKKRKEDKHEA